MAANVIRCATLGRFMAVVAECVQHGLTFTADADALVVTLTGGF